ncbi:MAG: DUF305 domain-containing protein [Frankiaceae bacterium]|nr:DUF305 domain-containing protein [Arenimonas sp.]
MKISKTPKILMPMLAGLLLTASVASVAHEPMAKPAAGKMPMHNQSSMEMMHIMMPGGDMKMKMTGDVDKDFAVMMSMHHQQAIEMVDVLIKSGRNPELKAMALKMKVAQQEEIKQMAKYTK